jgi:hypothetical protein
VSEAKVSVDKGRIGYINVLTAPALFEGIRIFSMERILTENLTNLRRR